MASQVMAVREVANKACATLLFGLASGKLPDVMQLVSSSEARVTTGRRSLLGCLNAADSSIRIDPALFERVVQDDPPLKDAHVAACGAVASAAGAALASVATQDDEEEGLSLDSLRGKVHGTFLNALDSGTLEKVFDNLADERKKLPDEVDEKVVEQEELQCLRLKALGRFANALDSGELDEVFLKIKKEVVPAPEEPPAKVSEVVEKPKRSKWRASLTEVPPPVPLILDEAAKAETAKAEAAQVDATEAEAARKEKEVTSPKPEKKRLSLSEKPPPMPTDQDVEASKVEPMKMRSRWRASVTEMPPDVPMLAAKEAGPAKEQIKEEEEIVPPSDAKQDDSVVEGQLRVLARDALIEASVDGRLAAALNQAGVDDEVAKTVKSTSDATAAPAVGSNAAPTPPVEVSPAPAVATKPTPTAPLAVVSTQPSTSNSAVGLALEAVAQRDRRVGELLAMISEAKRQIADREQRCSQIEEKLTCAKADIAHLELDVDWYKRALDGAKERNGALEDRKRKLMGELDGHTLKSRHAGIDALECGMSAPSEVSTATGGGTQSSIGCFTPGTGQLPPLDASSPRR